MIELVISKESREVNRYFLPQGITTLGRGEDNEIILDDVCVSRRHAQIRVDGERVLIEDLGSGNGIFCGETRIAKQELSDGDEVVIEPFLLELRLEPSSVAAGSSKQAAQPAPGADRAPHLKIISGGQGVFLLGNSEVSLGRAEDTDVVLQDPASSRRHAIISCSSNRFVLRDNGSANGTYVNGNPVEEHSLRPGDVILIGNTELEFVDPDSESPTLALGGRVEGNVETLDAGNNQPLFDSGSAPMSRPEISMSGGIEEDEGTEPGGPPPPVVTGSGPANLELSRGGGGYGVELDNELLGGGGSAPKGLFANLAWSFKNKPGFRLVSMGAGVLLVIVVGFAMISGRGSGVPVEPALEGIALQVVRAAEQQYRDASAKMQEFKFAEAIELFEKVVQTAGRKELSRVRRARDLASSAARQIGVLHEAQLLQTIGDAIGKRRSSLEANADALTAAESSLQASHKAATRRGSVKKWDRVIAAANSLLELDPGNASAREKLGQARTQRNKLVGAIGKKQRERLESDVQKLWNQAMALKRKGDAKSLQSAITVFEKVKKRDSDQRTRYYGQAETEIRATKNRLARGAQSQIDAAERMSEDLDWRGARKALQRALAIDPYSRLSKSLLAKVEKECSRNAQINFKKATVFADLNNNTDAKSACQLAMSYHSRKTDKFNRKCRDLLKTIERRLEGIR